MKTHIILTQGTESNHNSMALVKRARKIVAKALLLAVALVSLSPVAASGSAFAAAMPIEPVKPIPIIDPVWPRSSSSLYYEEKARNWRIGPPTPETTAPNQPVGFFSIPYSPNATSDLILLANGLYELGGHNVMGTYEINGDQITFVEYSGSDAVCIGTLGKHKWSLDNKVLTLHVIEDDCPERRSDFKDPMTLY